MRMAEKTDRESEMRGELERLRRQVGELSSEVARLREVESELGLSREMYVRLVDTSPYAVTIVDLEGKITYASERASEVHGFESPEDMLGLDAFDLIAPEDRSKAARSLREALERGRVDRVEFKFLKKDGTPFKGEVSACVLRGAGGTPYALLGMTGDLTEIKRMEEIVHATQERYRDLVENINDALYVLDPEGRILYVSPAIEAITGHEPSELIGSRIADYLHPEDVPVAREGIEGVLSGRLLPKELRVFAKSGQLKWVRVSSRPVPTPGGLVALQGVLTDITERKAADRRIEFLSSIVESLKDAVVVTDADRRITYVNDAALRLFGYDRGELLGEEFGVLFRTLGRRGGVWNLEEALADRDLADVEMQFKKKDGTLFTDEMRVSVMRNDGGEVICYVSLHRDVTEKKRLRQELLHSQKMEAVGTMAGGIAHDFNNLLTAIIGYSEMAVASCEEESRLRVDIQEINRTAKRAAWLTKRLLSFSRKQEIDLAPVDPSAMIVDLEELLRRLVPGDIEVVSEIDAGLGRVEADASQIEQVIVNLVTNARDAMPDGGRITLAATCVTLDEEACRGVAGAKPGRWVRLTVSDTGRGMDREVQKRIFEPFYTTKEAGRGTGLGLSVAYGIVANHRGWISVRSEPGVGSEFSVYLPAIDAARARGGGSRVREGGSSGGGMSVLLVDDREEVRAVVERGLASGGYLVRACASVAEAEAALSEENARFDVLLSDVVLPDGNGLDLAAAMRARNPGVGVLLMSGHADGKLDRSAIREKGCSFIGKPFEIRDLLQVLHEATSGRKSGSVK